MAKDKFTRKEASLQAYLEVAGIDLPEQTTFEEIKEYVRALPAAQIAQCRQLYQQYMSIGRPDYIENYNNK